MQYQLPSPEQLISPMPLLKYNISIFVSLHSQHTLIFIIPFAVNRKLEYSPLIFRKFLSFQGSPRFVQLKATSLRAEHRSVVRNRYFLFPFRIKFVQLRSSDCRTTRQPQKRADFGGILSILTGIDEVYSRRCRGARCLSSSSSSSTSHAQPPRKIRAD